MISTSTILSLCSRDIVGDEDFRRQFLIGRRDEEHFAVKPQLADDRVSRPLLDGDDAAFGPAARLSKRDFDFHLVAVHRGADQRGGYVNVAVDALNLFLGNDESVAVAMNHDRAFNQISRRQLRNDCLDAWRACLL